MKSLIPNKSVISPALPLFLIPFLMIFIFYFPIQSLVNAYCKEGDSQCYLKMLYEHMGMIFPLEKDLKECYHHIGAAYFWIPFGYLGKAMASLFREDVREAITSAISITGPLIWVGSFFSTVQNIHNTVVVLFGMALGVGSTQHTQYGLGFLSISS